MIKKYSDFGRDKFLDSIGVTGKDLEYFGHVYKMANLKNVKQVEQENPAWNCFNVYLETLTRAGAIMELVRTHMKKDFLATYTSRHRANTYPKFMQFNFDNAGKKYMIRVHNPSD